MLLDIFVEMIGYEVKMWGLSIIGFGVYYYKYVLGYEGDVLLVGFLFWKVKISLYFVIGDIEWELLLKELGKYMIGKVCVYINKVEDIYVDILKVLIN